MESRSAREYRISQMSIDELRTYTAFVLDLLERKSIVKNMSDQELKEEIDRLESSLRYYKYKCEDLEKKLLMEEIHAIHIKEQRENV